MTLLKVKGKQTSAIAVESEGSDVFIRGMRDGSLVNVPWLMAKAIEGKVFCANVGVMTGEDTFSPTIAAAMPDLLVTVPSGTTIIPVYLSVGFEDMGDNTAQVLSVFACSSNVYDNTSTGDTITICNMRTDKAAGGSQCVATAVVTSTGTDPESGNYVEFWRPMSGLAEDGFNGSVAQLLDSASYSKWTIGDAVVPPVIVGEGSLNVYCGAEAGKGFITAIWVEEATGTII